MRISIAAWICLAPVSLAGQVRVVGPAPAPYPRIQDAINASLPGDVVLVKSVNHDSIRITEKSLTIVADTGVTVQQAGAIRITGSNARALVVLAGITATGIQSAAVPELANGLVAESSPGSILIQDCTLQGYSGTAASCGPAGAGAAIQACSSVSFTRCTIRGGALSQLDAIAFRQGVGIEASTLSNVSCDDVDSRGGSGGLHCNTSYPGDGAGGGNGAQFTSSSLFASGSGFVGGGGGHVAGWPGPCTPGTWGGFGGNGLQILQPLAPVALRFLGTALTGMTGGSNCGGLISQGPIGGNVTGGQITSLTGTPRRLSGSRVVRDNELATLNFAGAANESVEIALSLGRAVHVYDASQKGVLHVPEPRWRAVGVVPAAGTFARTFKLPNLPPSDPGAVFVVQARFKDSITGLTRLSNAHVIVEVDATY